MYRLKLHKAGQKRQGDSGVLTCHSGETSLNTKDNQQRPQEGNI